MTMPLAVVAAGVLPLKAHGGALAFQFVLALVEPAGTLGIGIRPAGDEGADDGVLRNPAERSRSLPHHGGKAG